MQIFEIVRDYIKARRLYDVKNPAVVYCADDPIGRVFGVNRFTVRDVL